jgi:hypothetical protein
MRLPLSFLLISGLAIAAPPVSAATSDLVSLVPLEATTVAVVHLNDLRTSPLSSSLFLGADQIGVDGEMARFIADSGLHPADDIDTLLVSLRPGADGIGARPLLAAEGRFDPARLGAAVVARGATAKPTASGTLYVFPEHGDGNSGAVAFVDSHLVIGGEEGAVLKAMSDHQSGGTGFAQRAGLGRELGRVPVEATSWLLIDVPRSARFGTRPEVGSSHSSSSPFDGALRQVAVVAVWATDRKEALDIGGSAVSYDAETRQLLGDTVRGMIAAWRLAAQEKAPELLAALRNFHVIESTDAVTMTGSIPASVVKPWSDRVRNSDHCEVKR